MPYALERKYPNAGKEWGWQYVIPATSRFVDPQTGVQGRHHLHEMVLQRAVKEALCKTGIDKFAGWSYIQALICNSSIRRWL